MIFIKRFIVFLVFVAALFSGGFSYFAQNNIPHRVAEAPIRADAIVVLTGGTGRLDAGFRLLQQDRGKKLFISGIHTDATFPDIWTQNRAQNLNFIFRVELGYTATSTLENADEVKAWMTRNNYRSMHLVTSNYHLPRSVLLFTHAMPDVVIIPHPVLMAGVDPLQWYKSPRAVRIYFLEYIKYLFMTATYWLV